MKRPEIFKGIEAGWPEKANPSRTRSTTHPGIGGVGGTGVVTAGALLGWLPI